jgi:hypothetical protein
VYPEYEWLPWRFPRTPKQYWENDVNKKKFLDWAAKELGIKEHTDWYRVSTKDIQELGGGSLLSKFGLSLTQLLSHVYPELKWTIASDKSKSSFHKKTQHLLHVMLKSIFPQEGKVEFEILYNRLSRGVGGV